MREKIVNDLAIFIQYNIIKINLSTNRNDLNTKSKFTFIQIVNYLINGQLSWNNCNQL